MKYAVDLHIHSALSPCAHEDMTPNNIVNMALLKGLDIIAVTDHNTAENLEAIMECAGGTGLVVVPGMEVESSEEIHIVCLFPDLRQVLIAQEEIYKALPPVKNREDIFGEQLVLDRNDHIVSKNDRFLITACSLSIYDIFKLTRKLGGVPIPAHINRDSYSILATLGSIPEDLFATAVEVTGMPSEAALFSIFHTYASEQTHANDNAYVVIRSSDAHCLEDISERTFVVDLPLKDIPSLLRFLDKKSSPDA